MTEYENGKWERNLPYPLQDAEFSEYTENNNGAITNITPSWFPTDDQDEKVDFVVRMSLSEFTAIASAIDIGRDIGYGERSYELWRTWCKALIGELMINCEDVADCIESEIGAGNTTLINTLTQNAINNGFGNPNRINPAITTVMDRNPIGALQEEIKSLLNCNLDALWGGIRHGIVERLDDNARDLLEDLAAVPNTLERLAVFIDTVPIIGDIAEGLAFQITEIVPDLLDLFDSYSSLEALDEIACEIFSIVCADCRYPTFEEVFNRYFDASLSGLPALANMTLNDIAQALLDIVSNPASIAYNTMLVWELFTLNAQAAFNGISGTKAITKMAEIGEDFGSDNWLELCDSCNENYVLWTWDFRTQGQGEFYPDTVQTSGQGVFEAGKGWRCVNNSTGRRFVVAMKIDPTWKFYGVAMLVTGDTGNSWQWTRRPTWGSTSGQQASSAGGANLPTWTRYWEGYGGLIDGVNEVYFFTQWTGQTAVAHLAKVSFLFGKGYSPPDSGVRTNDVTPYSSP